MGALTWPTDKSSALTSHWKVPWELELWFSSIRTLRALAALMSSDGLRLEPPLTAPALSPSTACLRPPRTLCFAAPRPLCPQAVPTCSTLRWNSPTPDAAVIAADLPLSPLPLGRLAPATTSVLLLLVEPMSAAAPTSAPLPTNSPSADRNKHRTFLSYL